MAQQEGKCLSCWAGMHDQCLGKSWMGGGWVTCICECGGGKAGKKNSDQTG